jgi:hypothetical protein
MTELLSLIAKEYTLHDMNEPNQEKLDNRISSALGSYLEVKKILEEDRPK